MITLMGSFGEANKNVTFRRYINFSHSQNYRGRILLSQFDSSLPLVTTVMMCTWLCPGLWLVAAMNTGVTTDNV